MPPRLPRKGPHVTFRVEVLDASATRVGHVVVLSVPATSLVAAVKHYVANRHSMLTKAVAESGALYLGDDRVSDRKTLAECDVKPGAQLTLKLPDGAPVTEGAVEPRAGAGAGAGAGVGAGAAPVAPAGARRVGTDGICVLWAGIEDDGSLEFHPPWTRATTFSEMFDQGRDVVDEFAERAADGREYELVDLAVYGHADSEWDEPSEDDPDGDNQPISAIARLCGITGDITFILTVEVYDPDNDDDSDMVSVQTSGDNDTDDDDDDDSSETDMTEEEEDEVFMDPDTVDDDGVHASWNYPDSSSESDY